MWLLIVFELMVKRPSSALSIISIEEVSVVSLSDAVRVSVLPLISNKKFSSIAKEFFELTTRPNALSWADRALLETENFIMVLLILLIILIGYKFTKNLLELRKKNLKN